MALRENNVWIGLRGRAKNLMGPARAHFRPDARRHVGVSSLNNAVLDRASWPNHPQTSSSRWPRDKMDNGGGKLRRSCTQCTTARKKCLQDDRPATAATSNAAEAKCSRCARLNLECVYLKPEKRGPKGPWSHKRKEREAEAARKASGTTGAASVSVDAAEKTGPTGAKKDSDSRSPTESTSVSGSSGDTGTDSVSNAVTASKARSRATPASAKNQTSTVSQKAKASGASALKKQAQQLIAAVAGATNATPATGALLAEQTAALAAATTQAQVTEAIFAVINSNNLVPTPTIVPQYPPQMELPDANLVNTIVSSYCAIYMHLPITIRSEALAELTMGAMPDYLAYSILFWSSWYSNNLPEIMGRAQHRQIVSLLFNRVQMAIKPALEAVLAGYDAFFGNPDMDVTLDVPLWPSEREQRRDVFNSMAVSVVLSLIHVCDVALVFKTATGDPFTDLDAVLSLAIRAARAGRLNHERVYGSYERRHGMVSPLLERARRAWWMLVLMDRQVAIMYDRETQISMDNCRGIRVYQAEGEYEERRALPEPTFDSPGFGSAPPPPPEMIAMMQAMAAAGPPDLSHLYPFTQASNHLVSTVLKSSNGQATTGAQPLELSGNPARPLFDHPQLGSSYAPDGVISPSRGVLRLFILANRVAEYRRKHARPYLDTPERKELAKALEEWFDELPAAIKGVDTMVLRNPEFGVPAADGSEADLRHFIALVVLSLAIYHTSQVLLSSPADSKAWSGQLDPEWLASPAFLVAQEHAIRTTALLQIMLHTNTKIEEMAQPVSFFSWRRR